jgi:hypothetical protein
MSTLLSQNSYLKPLDSTITIYLTAYHKILSKISGFGHNTVSQPYYHRLCLQSLFSAITHYLNPSTKELNLKLFRTMRSRDHDVVVVRRTINLGYWEFGMGREWRGVEKGEVSLQVT